MPEISNKTIVLLLLLTLAVTLSGTFLSINRLIPLGADLFGITGAGTSNATGTTFVTIQSNTAITNDAASMNFSSGYVNGTCSECRLDTDNGTQGGTATANCCVNFTNVTTGFLLENTGNINISVNYICAFNCTAATLIGGTKPGFMIKWTANSVETQAGEIGATDTAASCNGKFNATYENVSAAGKTICGNVSGTNNDTLDFVNSQDAFVVDINLTIPVDATSTGSGQRQAIFTFNASSSG